jgi:hypothetical protein
MSYINTKRETESCQDFQEDKYSNAWNQRFAAPPQMDHSESFVRLFKKTSIPMHGIKDLQHPLKWIILTLFSMSMMFLRMTEKKLFGKKYSFYILSLNIA